MNIENIKSLNSSLQALGFKKTVLQQLVINTNLKRQEFIIHERMSWDNDVINFHLAFERNGNMGSYSCLHYDATLRKEIEIPNAKINNIEVKELDKRMKEINWTNVFEYGENKKWEIEDKATWLEEEKVENIVADLQIVESFEEGKEICCLLKVKHWCDTPLEELFTELTSVRNRFEVSQRFYFLDGRSGISVDEAYRFLHNRWMEKQLLAKKKQGNISKENDDVSKIGSGRSSSKKKGKDKHGKSKI